MFEDGQYIVVIVAIAVIAALEVWRRTLRNRAPRWIHVVTMLLLASIACGVAYTQWALGGLAESLAGDDPANKATNLARGISRAMNGNAIAAASAILAALVLGIAAWRARGLPEGGPVAQIR